MEQRLCFAQPKELVKVSQYVIRDTLHVLSIITENIDTDTTLILLHLVTGFSKTY
jgi:hypothetical protein